jgi:hypothetical protein
MVWPWIPLGSFKRLFVDKEVFLESTVQSKGHTIKAWGDMGR